MESKFFEIQDGEQTPVVYEDLFELQGDQLRIAARADHLELIHALLDNLQGPFEIAYDLLEDDHEREGRYLSPPVDLAMARDFLSIYGDFFVSDGRHEVSFSGDGVLTLDQHNLILVTGPLEACLEEVRTRGLREGTIRLPFPHGHGFHARFDDVLVQLLDQFDWTRVDIPESA